MQVIDTVKRTVLLSKRYFVAGITLFVLGVCIALVAVNIKQVTIIDDGNTITKITFGSTVEGLLDKSGIVLGRWDTVEPSLDTMLERNQEIVIKRAVPIVVNVDGKAVHLKTSKETVEEALNYAGIRVEEQDIVNVDFSAPIVKDMNIDIVRVVEKEIVVTEKIPYKSINRANYNMEKGRTVEFRQGSDGEVEKCYTVVMHDGNEVSRELIAENVIKEPVDKIIEYGTVDVYKSSRGETFRYKKVLNMKATAYDLSYESCGKHPDHPLYGITASGMKARKGVVSVDPKVIPLHTRLYIEATDGSWAYGYAVAGDTGGAVKVIR